MKPHDTETEDPSGRAAEALTEALDRARDQLTALQDRAALRSHLGMKELEQRFSKLEARVEAARRGATDDSDEELDALHREVKGVLSQLQRIDDSTPAGGRPEAGRLSPEPRV